MLERRGAFGGGASRRPVTCSTAAGAARTVTAVTYDQYDARHAAEVAAEGLGLRGPLSHLGTSMASAYACDGAVLRVTLFDGTDSADVTLALAAAAGQAVRVARPLRERAIHVDSGPGSWAVEAYERIEAVSRPTPSQLGDQLALLHAADVTGWASEIPAGRRLQASRDLLEAELSDPARPWHRAAVRLASGLDALLALSDGLDTPRRLCHLDPSLTNLLVDRSGPVWIDWESAGHAPAALDVALAFGEMCRFHGAQAAVDMLQSYQRAGGVAPMAHVIMFMCARDHCGAADCFPPQHGPAWGRLIRQRLDTLGEVAMSTRWDALATLHPQG